MPQMGNLKLIAAISVAVCLIGLVLWVGVKGVNYGRTHEQNKELSYQMDALRKAHKAQDEYDRCVAAGGDAICLQPEFERKD